MITSLMLLLGVGSGIILTSIFGSKTFDSWPERIAAGIVLGISAVAGLTSIFNIFCSTNTANLLAWVLFGSISLISLGFHFKKIRKTINTSPNYFDWFDWVLVFIFSSLIILLMFLQLTPNGSGLTIPQARSFDTIFHTAQIKYIAQQSNWHFTSPYFAGEFINYPFFSELFSAGLVKLGGSFLLAYHLPNFVLTFSLIIWLICLAKLFTKNKFLTLLIILGVLFAAGLSYLNSQYFFTAPTSVSYPLQPIGFQGLVLSFLLFQKSFVLGAPLGLACLYALIKYLQTNNRNSLVWALIFGALLPFAHTHTFVAISLGLFGMFASLMLIDNEKAKKMLIYILWFILLTLPQVLAIVLLPKFSLGTTPFMRLGWMSNIHEAGGLKLSSTNPSVFTSWLLYQFWSFGSLLLWPFLLILVWKKRYEQQLAAALFYGGSFIWLSSNLIQFQVWDFDNNKLFVYALLFLFLATINLVSVAQKTSAKILTVTFGMIILFSLPMSVFRVYQTISLSHNQQVSIFTDEQRLVSNWIKTNTSLDSVMFSGLNLSPQDSSYLASVESGRANTLAFGLWLYTHDTDFQPRFKSINEFLNDPTTKNNIPADYFILGPETTAQFPNLKTQLKEAGFKNLYSNKAFTVYSLKN